MRDSHNRGVVPEGVDDPVPSLRAAAMPRPGRGRSVWRRQYQTARRDSGRAAQLERHRASVGPLRPQEARLPRKRLHTCPMGCAGCSDGFCPVVCPCSTSRSGRQSRRPPWPGWKGDTYAHQIARASWSNSGSNSGSHSRLHGLGVSLGVSLGTGIHRYSVTEVSLFSLDVSLLLSTFCLRALL
jgi:hypothetical protein